MSKSDNSFSILNSFASGKTIGGEPAFVFPVVLTAVKACGDFDIAVLGVELFIARSQGYETKAISSYEFLLTDYSWTDFVAINNRSADSFVHLNQGGDDHFYLLTVSTEAELLARIR